MTSNSMKAQKPVGSAAWISAEKENIAQLVNQEIEEIEYPVRHEMLWLNEHMAEIFSKNQVNLADVFKTPGKLRGKTPHTARKRTVEETRVPLSEIFAAARPQAEHRATPSPTVQRTIPKPNKPAVTTNDKSAIVSNNATQSESQPDYPDLTENLNSFPQYNTDSGYHGMPEEEDEMVLTQVQPESQTLTQPVDEEATPIAARPSPDRASTDRSTTEQSFHSARESIRQRGETAEPLVEEPTPTRLPLASPSKTQSEQPESSGKRKELPKEPERQTESKRVVADGSPVSSDKQSARKPAAPYTLKTPAPQSHEPDIMDVDDHAEDMALDNLDDIGSPSDGSTPERPFMRKSSLNFASLPAREPLTTKKSMGGSRISRTSHIDIPKLNGATRTSYYPQNGGSRITQAIPSDEDGDMASGEKMDIDRDGDVSGRGADADSASRLHSKSSTQRLAEKISMLGKHQPSRPTKSIPAAPVSSAGPVLYPELPSVKPDAKSDLDEEKRSRLERGSSRVPDGHEAAALASATGQPFKATTKSADSAPDRMVDGGMASNGKQELTEMKLSDKPTPSYAAGTVPAKSSIPVSQSPRPASRKKSASVSTLTIQTSTTPTGSPRRQDGPLSASKSRFQSIMKSAKGLFTGGINSPTAARGEGLSSSPSRPQTADSAQATGPRVRPELQPLRLPSSPSRQDGRKTRSSTEREQRRKEQEVEERRLEEERQQKMREQERHKAAQAKALQEKALQQTEDRTAPATQQPTASHAMEAVQPQHRHASREPEVSHEIAPKNALSRPSTQPLSKANDRRPVKPTREPIQKPKPQPVSIRVGSALSRQMPIAATALSSSVQEPNPPTVAPPSSSSSTKPPSLRKKTSNTSLHTASSMGSFKSSVSSQSQRKAQLATDRKKQQEEREARKREEQKRELELKRAAQQQQQQEEARRQELRNRAEAERRERERERLAVEDPKKAAQMQAIEKRRLENARRHERQGSQQPIGDLSSILQAEKSAPPQQHQRGDLGTARPPSRLGSMQPFGRSVNHPPPNPAKPPKRAMDEEASQRPPAPKPSAAQHPGDPKRRKTDDDPLALPPVRPTMAPPIRQSAIRKEQSKPQAFNHGSSQASGSHQSSSSIFKTAPGPGAGQGQRPVHPMDMAKYTSGKIPFADGPQTAGAGPTLHKGPAAVPQRPPAKPSPKYPNGENIHLPEIPTDSEDEDSDADILPVPAWAQPDQLENILRTQEGMEADSIFGPIAPFSLEETFKADKKIKKYRERTSSANWSGADGLTQDEIRRDLAERQRLRLNGGWTFGS